ncbi:acyltransferase family protein [Seonamhaeicola aphaedonensis]|uniref:Peptidoglycan/LPS O-acetylase OafA/YrhL n=1 Tax=Seonamhaeicola aphaedonensis TaxID=1461338 RepID=A0A3D9HG43_9FLAO|nr:acyltransferase [Seonamhaeicola aphaedonensis]RED48430.1 peptidoglycan/LPS O-acetylase OafA/YrhL [Seonamhaeicola aphaedonensis]
MTSELKRNFGLDLLRSIAISLVVISHSTYLLFPQNTSFYVTFFRTIGAVGVDLFFVLSGFLIGGILLKLITERKTNFNKLFKFWKRRWFRTLPNYFLILVVNILLLLIQGIGLPDNIFLYFVFLQNVLSPHPDFFTEAWSLSIEEYAYLLLPFLIFLSFRLFNKASKRALFIWTSILTIALLMFFKWKYFKTVSVINYQEWSATFRKVIIYRMDSIYFGFVLVYLIRTFPKYIKEYKNLLFVLGFSLFVLLHLVIYYFNIQPQNNLFFYTFIYLQVIIISLAMLFPFFLNLKNVKKCINKMVLFVSTRSYAIYLINYSIVLLSVEKLMHTFTPSMFEKWLLVIIFMVITLVASNIIYVYFEKPILKYRDRKFPR